MGNDKLTEALTETLRQLREERTAKLHDLNAPDWKQDQIRDIIEQSETIGKLTAMRYTNAQLYTIEFLPGTER